MPWRRDSSRIRMICDVWTSVNDETLRLVTEPGLGIPFPLMGEQWRLAGAGVVSPTVAAAMARSGFVTWRSPHPFVPGTFIDPGGEHDGPADSIRSQTARAPSIRS